jgi:hypothetical protein
MICRPLSSNAGSWAVLSVTVQHVQVASSTVSSSADPSRQPTSIGAARQHCRYSHGDRFTRKGREVVQYGTVPRKECG